MKEVPLAEEVMEENPNAPPAPEPASAEPQVEKSILPVPGTSEEPKENGNGHARGNGFIPLVTVVGFHHAR